MLKKHIQKWLRALIEKIYPEIVDIKKLIEPNSNIFFNSNVLQNSNVSIKAKSLAPYKIIDSVINDYTYIAQNSIISKTTIGKFCSIGPNLLCGWGIHPTNGLSTAPMFYSTLKQNGMTLSNIDKIEERKPIIIGNDVFIGANVTILDGVTIGDGAVIGAGAVVSKDIPAYAIAVGCPIQIKRFRFSNDQISKILAIQWWNFTDDKLKDVEKMFFNIDQFIETYD